MKTLLNFIFIATLLFTSNYIDGQPCCVVPSRKHKVDYVDPILIDSGTFISDLKNKIDLKGLLRKLKKDDLLGIYMYTFYINEKGDLKPISYYNRKNHLLKSIQNFAVSTFNNYHWKAGHKKKCQTCKVKVYLQLIIDFEPKSNIVSVKIEDLDTLGTVFQYSMDFNRH